MEQLLPIGSVVTLQGAERKLMVVGLAVSDQKTNTVYDYIGEPFPEGYIDAETMFLFNHADIQEVHFLGYVNAEAQAYRTQLFRELEEKDILKRP